jgi:tRNA pseudouridine32 synthase/23S rRNA pseudouridine746 synthase
LIPVIAQSDGWLLIDKPAGLDMHSKDGEQGLVSRVSAEQDQPLFPVHRLDKLTSGLVLLATSAESCELLAAQFRARSVDKLYLALATDKPKKKQGAIIGDMARARRGDWKLLRSRENPAITRFVSHSILPGLRLFLLKPQTGRTHQLRVALKSLGSPVLGDVRYSGGEADRGYLHACSLSFDWQGERRCFRQLPTAGERWPQLDNVLLDDLQQRLPTG